MSDREVLLALVGLVYLAGGAAWGIEFAHAWLRPLPGTRKGAARGLLLTPVWPVLALALGVWAAARVLRKLWADAWG